MSAALAARAAVELGPAEREHLARWARRPYPREACGLLLGRRAGNRTEVVHVTEARNLAAEGVRERFELDPADHLAAEERARTLGLEVVGTWHSHPDQPARPSALDRAGTWSGWISLIVAVEAGGGGELRAWRPANGGWVECALRMVGAPQRGAGPTALPILCALSS